MLWYTSQSFLGWNINLECFHEKFLRNWEFCRSGGIQFFRCISKTNILCGEHDYYFDHGLKLNRRAHILQAILPYEQVSSYLSQIIMIPQNENLTIHKFNKSIKMHFPISICTELIENHWKSFVRYFPIHQKKFDIGVILSTFISPCSNG